jgi:hypothetical protein
MAKKRTVIYGGSNKVGEVRIKRLSKIINMKSRHFVSAAVDSVDSAGSKGGCVVEVRY